MLHGCGVNVVFITAPHSLSQELNGIIHLGIIGTACEKWKMYCVSGLATSELCWKDRKCRFVLKCGWLQERQHVGGFYQIFAQFAEAFSCFISPASFGQGNRKCLWLITCVTPWHPMGSLSQQERPTNPNHTHSLSAADHITLLE